MITVRPFHPEDIAEVAAIEEAVFPAPWSCGAFLKFSKDLHYRFRVALQDEKIAGYWVAQVVGEEAELHNIAVSASNRRRGVGSALLKDFLKVAAELGVCEVFLMVRVSNQAAQNFYQKFQFDECGRRPNAYQNPPEEGRILHKRLDTKR